MAYSIFCLILLLVILLPPPVFFSCLLLLLFLAGIPTLCMMGTGVSTIKKIIYTKVGEDENRR